MIEVVRMWSYKKDKGRKVEKKRKVTIYSSKSEYRKLYTPSQRSKH